MAKPSKRSIAAKQAWANRKSTKFVPAIKASSIKSICDEMDEALTNLENVMRATTKRINTIMKAG